MEYNPEIIKIFDRALNDCPESQLIMAEAFMYGDGVPKNERNAYLFYKLLADHKPEELEGIMDSDYGTLLALIGLLAERQEEYDTVMDYSIRALNYIWDTHPKEEAIAKIEYLRLGETLDETEAILSNQ